MLTDEQKENPMLVAFAKAYFVKVDHMPSDAWERLPKRMMDEHLERMSKILGLIPDADAAYKKGQEDKERTLLDQLVYSHEQFAVTPEGDKAFRHHVLSLKESK